MCLLSFLLKRTHCLSQFSHQPSPPPAINYKYKREVKSVPRHKSGAHDPPFPPTPPPPRNMMLHWSSRRGGIIPLIFPVGGCFLLLTFFAPSRLFLTATHFPLPSPRIHASSFTVHFSLPLHVVVSRFEKHRSHYFVSHNDKKRTEQTLPDNQVLSLILFAVLCG